ncbi:MAG: 5-formyltetrahydrofolate cyclo-ligase [Roseobacter sp.]
MKDLAEIKKTARMEGFARRREAHAADPGTGAGLLSSVLAAYRGVPLSGYMPIRTEINPLPAMVEASAHGPVGVPVIVAESQPLRFARWEPEMPMISGPFGARIPQECDFFDPEILIVPMVAFDASGGRLGYGGGYYDRTLEKLRAARATLAIGFAYEAQKAMNLPLEPTDQPLDMIVTEAGVYDLR